MKDIHRALCVCAIVIIAFVALYYLWYHYFTPTTTKSPNPTPTTTKSPNPTPTTTKSPNPIPVVSPSSTPTPKAEESQSTGSLFNSGNRSKGPSGDDLIFYSVIGVVILMGSIFACVVIWYFVLRWLSNRNSKDEYKPALTQPMDSSGSRYQYGSSHTHESYESSLNDQKYKLNQLVKENKLLEEKLQAIPQNIDEGVKNCLKRIDYDERLRVLSSKIDIIQNELSKRSTKDDLNNYISDAKYTLDRKLHTLDRNLQDSEARQKTTVESSITEESNKVKEYVNDVFNKQANTINGQLEILQKNLSDDLSEKLSEINDRLENHDQWRIDQAQKRFGKTIDKAERGLDHLTKTLGTSANDLQLLKSVGIFLKCLRSMREKPDTPAAAKDVLKRFEASLVRSQAQPLCVIADLQDALEAARNDVNESLEGGKSHDTKIEKIDAAIENVTEAAGKLSTFENPDGKIVMLFLESFIGSLDDLEPQTRVLFDESLSMLGVSRIPVTERQTRCNPDLHLRVSSVNEGNQPEGVIVRIVKPGYRWAGGGDVIRQVRVVVHE
ncbi:MAG: hypothetical protein WCH07_03270 [Deltaproteobacteria bacterium]